MLKSLIVSVIACFIFSGLSAQKSQKDSLVKIAEADAKLFKLSKDQLKAFREDKGNYSSDLFKPNPGLTTNAALLDDSVYVKAFRSAAYKKTLKRRTAGHWLLVGGGIYAGVGLALSVVAIFALLAAASK